MREARKILLFLYRHSYGVIFFSLFFSVTLFILMVVNNWYIIMVGIVRGSEGVEKREEGRRKDREGGWEEERRKERRGRRVVL